MNTAVWVGSVARDPKGIAEAIDNGVNGVGWTPSRGARWVVKLNLTYPTYLPGVVNAPEFVEGLCLWASNQEVDLVLIEGDSGNGSYSAEDTFESNGVAQIAARYGARCVSISEEPWEWRRTLVHGVEVVLPYSAFFTRKEYDVLATAPLFKNHIFTTVTLGMKNLWGCIPDAYRMYYHHQLDRGIVALQKELAVDLSIFDGLVGMRGRGPMEGHAIDLDLIMVAGSVGAGEVAALDIMGVDLGVVEHPKIAAREGLLPKLHEIVWLGDKDRHHRSDFKVERTCLNQLTIQLGRFPKLQKVIYHSALSPTIYRIVNHIRGESAQTRLLRDKWAGQYRTIDHETDR